MISTFVLSQILIGIAFLFDLASFQFKKRETTLLLFFCAASLISVHFFLLGAVTGGLVIAVSAFRFLVSMYTTDSRLMWVFLMLIGGLGIWTFSGYEDIFSIAMGTLGTLAAFQASEKRLRQFMMAATSCAITYNVLIFSPAAIALEIFFLGSNLLSYWRFYVRKQVIEDPSET